MEDLEKNIEEGAKIFAGFKMAKPPKAQIDVITNKVNESFIAGAKSPEAKEYWYNKFCEEITEADEFIEFSKKCASIHYQTDSLDWDMVYRSIRFGMGCELTKQYWQRRMYTEKELELAFNAGRTVENYKGKWIEVYTDSHTYPVYPEFKDWFELNKKKI